MLVAKRCQRLVTLALAVAAFAAAALIAACGGDGPVTFTHGVASGDVTPDGAVLWTRVDRETDLTLEIATDGAFADLALEREASADAETDFTVKVGVTSLEPATEYTYRFRRNDDVSDTGTFRTAPAAADAAPVRFVFSGDSDGTVKEDGTRAFDFAVLDAARAEEADFFLYFGDTIYADSGFGPKPAETLDEYRDKYKMNREITPLQRILAATSIYTTWDDHEVLNDFAGTTVDPGLLAAGRRAFREYMPLSGDAQPDVLYRSFRWGQAVELIILDERSFRDPDVEDACVPDGQEEPDALPGLARPDAPEAFRGFREFVGLAAETAPECVEALDDTERTMLGREQKDFLLNALRESDATFKFIVNSVPVTELVALPYDRWEGYRAERDEILRFIAEEEIGNVVFLTTDFHASILSDVRLDLDPDSVPVAVEAITGPIAHATLGDDIAALQSEDVIPVFEQLIKQVAQADCVEFDAFSYGLVEVDPAAGTATITLKDEDGTELCRRVLEAG